MIKVVPLLLLFSLVACSSNMVEPEDSGKKVKDELEQRAKEAAIERQQFDFAIQAKGGRFLSDPELSAYVAQIGNKLAPLTKRDLDFEFVITNQSLPNAWATPGGKVGISRGMLVSLDSEAELAAVLAHQLVHITRGKHQTSKQKPSTYNQLDAPREQNYIVGDATRVDWFLSQVFDRFDELSADRKGQDNIAALGYDPRAFVTLQEKFFGHKTAEAPLWREFLTHHVPTEELHLRNSENVNRLEFNLGKTDWNLGEDTYQQKVSRLKSEAYTNYDKSLAAEDAGRAVELLQKSVEVFPQEAVFSVELARRLHDLGQSGEALALLDSASGDGPQYRSHLLKGTILQQQGDNTGAYQSFRASYDALPTALAALALGPLEESRGNPGEAKRYYAALMSRAGAYEDYTRDDFIRLDIVDNPPLYFLAQSLVRDEQFMTIITNQSGYRVEGLSVAFSATINGQELQHSAQTGPLEPNTQVRLYPSWAVLAGDKVEGIFVRVTEVLMNTP